MSDILKRKEYPILEWDENRVSIIEPSKLIKKIKGISEHCVITFFREAIERKKEKGELKEIARLRSETL
ncbi:MAG: uridine phosphorylase, partial [Oscillospiraceae bacterium]|nr:uridine phosphorylase [Oscillospiraceae bacterium]